MTARALGINETVRHIAIHARERWNPLGVIARPGEAFRFEATGEWIDWCIASGPSGQLGVGIQRWTHWTKRYPPAPWFAVIGALGQRDDGLFLIGETTTWANTTDRAEELYAFANDAWLLYFNNKGEIALTITRTS